MNRKPIVSVCAALAVSALPAFVQAQSTATGSDASTSPSAAPVPAEPQDEEIITLSPFEVSSSRDTGYQATETLAGTRIRTNLRDVGSAIQVITPEFIKDVGATDNSTLLQYTTNAEVAGTRGTYAGLGNATSVDESGSLRAPGSANRVRGLASADNTRDFFVTDIPWDNYNVSRIDIQRGPNSILFGLGSPAGIVNASLRDAEFRDTGSVDYRIASYGSQRASVDVNKEIIDNVLSLRVAGLWDAEKFKQKPAYEDDKRIYTTLRFDPKLIQDGRTSLKIKYEHGDIQANRPRIIPPNDSFTPWFRPVNNTSLEGGMGKLTINNGYPVGAATTSLNPWLGGGGIDQQQPAWFIDGASNQLYRIYGGYVNRGARNADGSVRAAGDNLVGQRYSQPFFGLNSLNSFASVAGLPGSLYGQYRTASLTDSSVFNFYDQLIDGPNKKEFEGWDAHSIDISQTAMGDRIGVQFTYDRQRYERGGEALLGNSPTLNIDILRNFQDRPEVAADAAATNPNFGRPYVLAGPGSGNSYESDREYIRGSVFGELRANDFFDSDSLLAKILGKHRINGVYSKEDYQVETRSWQMYANNREWDTFWTRVDGSSNGINNRPPVGVVYLGGSVASRADSAGSNIPNIKSKVTLDDGNLYFFDSTWTGAGVAYNAPWTVDAKYTNMFNANALPAAQNGQFYQNSNPANYVGWNSNFQMNLLRYNDGEDLSLLRNASKTFRSTTSYATSWQSYLWNESIIPTFGWRYDEVETRTVTADSVSGNRAILNMNTTGPRAYRLPDSRYVRYSNQGYSMFKDHSVAGGVVVHMNRLFGRDFLPLNVSLSYNDSSNFQVTNARRDIYGGVIGNPSGSTKEYGILLSTKDGKYSLRALQYKTELQNADTQLDASGLTGTIKNGLNWRNIMLYRMSGYVWATRETNNQRHDWIPHYVNQYGRSVWSQDKVNATPSQPAPAGSVLQTTEQSIAMRDASIRAWNDIQKFLSARGYFTAWNYSTSPTTESALTDRATYEANPSAYQPDPATVYDYRNNPNLQGFAVTSDSESKGYEFEFTANPLPNWRISLNAAQTKAMRMNVGGEKLDELVNYLTEQIGSATVHGAAGDMIMFNGHFDDPTNVIWNNGAWKTFRSGYTLMKLQENAAASELRKWRFNLVTNYAFTEGLLRGFGLGGAYRWQDKVVIGYPVLEGEGGLATFDLEKPYYGPSESGIDLWASYERKLTDKVNWKIQLNVRNAFASDDLVPISVQPDGKTWASVRMAPTQEWFLSNTFSF